MRDRRRGSMPTGVVRIAAVIAVGLGLTGCGEAADPVIVLDSASPTLGTTADSSIESSTQPTVPGDGGNGGGAVTTPVTGGGSGGSGGPGSGGGGQPASEPPYVRDVYPDAFLTTDDDTDEEIIGAIIQGHAYDPDGPDHQESTARVRVDWGDGTTSDASLEGHGAFNAWHRYDLSHLGRTMTVRIVAYGHDGQTATKTITLALPEG